MRFEIRSLFVVRPIPGSLHSPLPLAIPPLTLVGGHGRREAPIEQPVARDVLKTFPIADGQSRQISGPKSRRLANDRA